MYAVTVWIPGHGDSCQKLFVLVFRIDITIISLTGEAQFCPEMAQNIALADDGPCALAPVAA
jgi:hypothetical protein